MKKAIIVDLHKTIMDKNGNPIQEMISLVNDLAINNAILIVSDDKESNRRKLLTWLKNNNVSITKLFLSKQITADMSSPEVKDYIYNHDIKNKYEVTTAIDNNKKNCKMYHKNNINVLHFKEAK